MLHIFSGARTANKDTLACSVVGCCTDCGIDMRCHEIDYLNCECGYAEHNQEADPPAGERQGGGCYCADPQTCGNILRDEVFDRLLADARGGRFLCIVAGIPCDGYCTARFRSEMDGLARPLRNRYRPHGLPDLSAHHRARLATSNSLTVRGLMLCAAVWESGGEVLIENPPDYGAYGELWAVNPRTGKDDEALRNLKFNGDHCPLWKTDWAEAFLAATKSRKFSFAQCQFGSAYQKYTVLAATLRWAQLGPSGHTPFECFHGRYCRCRGAHEKRAIGVDAHGRYVSEAAAWYPREMNLAIARAVRALAKTAVESGGGPRSSVDRAARVDALRDTWALLGRRRRRAAAIRTRQASTRPRASRSRRRPAAKRRRPASGPRARPTRRRPRGRRRSCRWASHSAGRRGAQHPERRLGGAHIWRMAPRARASAAGETRKRGASTTWTRTRVVRTRPVDCVFDCECDPVQRRASCDTRVFLRSGSASRSAQLRRTERNNSIIVKSFHSFYTRTFLPCMRAYRRPRTSMHASPRPLARPDRRKNNIRFYSRPLPPTDRTCHMCTVRAKQFSCSPPPCLRQARRLRSER